MSVTINNGQAEILFSSGAIDATTRAGMKLLYSFAVQMDDPVFVDAGAGEGAFSLLAGLVPGMTVHAFEPNPHTADVLRENVAFNDLGDRISVHECALSDNNQPGFLRCPKKWGLATLARDVFSNGVTYPVRVDTLDTALHGERIDLLKLDVEGCEKFALLGGKTIIRRCRPVILAETQNKRTRMFGYGAGDITKLLRSWAYEDETVTTRDTLYQHKNKHIETKEAIECLQFTQL